jgi:hypothetical protein
MHVTPLHLSCGCRTSLCLELPHNNTPKHTHISTDNPPAYCNLKSPTQIATRIAVLPKAPCGTTRTITRTGPLPATIPMPRTHLA